MAGETKVLNFSEGASVGNPSQPFVACSSLVTYATDAAFVSAKGSVAAAGDEYWNTTFLTVRIYDGTNWQSITDPDVVVQTKTTTYAALITDDIIKADTSGGGWTLTLPTAVGFSGKKYLIYKTTSDASLLTVATTSSQTIDGGTTYKISNQYESIHIESDGANWLIVGKKEFNQSAYELRNLSIVATSSAGVMTIAVKDLLGNDCTVANPAYVTFRNVTATSGTPIRRAITASLSMTLATTATLGGLSGVGYYIYVYIFDNAGTLTLGASLVAQDEASLQSSSTSTTSNQVIFQASALSSKAVRIIGRISATNTTNSWASPSEVCNFPFYIPPIIASYYASANGSFGAAASLNFDAKLIDSHNSCVPSAAGTGTWLFTAPKTASYLFTGFVAISAAAYDGFGVRKNATLFASIGIAAAVGIQGCQVSFLLSLAKGDTIDVVDYNSTRTFLGGAVTAEACYLNIQEVK